MKRIVALATIFILLYSVVLAEEIDLSKYSIEELNALQERITQEISNRNTSEPGWYDYGIGALLPKPITIDGKELKIGGFVLNDDDTFYAQIKGASSDDFSNYIAAVKTCGFTIEAERGTISYEAYNADGYHISMLYFGTSGITVDVDAPKTVGVLSWPSSEIAALLPVPDSKTGSVSWEASYGFVAYVSYTKDQYDEYVNSCVANGFTVDYRKGDTYYYAYNSDGYSLSLKYEGFNTMFVRIDEPEKE